MIKYFGYLNRHNTLCLDNLKIAGSRPMLDNFFHVVFFYHILCKKIFCKDIPFLFLSNLFSLSIFAQDVLFQ